MNNKPVRRFVSKFRKGTDGPLQEVALTDVSLSALQMIFQRPLQDLMYASFDITEREARAMQPFAAETFDLDKYEYFLEAEVSPRVRDGRQSGEPRSLEANSSEPPVTSSPTRQRRSASEKKTYK